MTPTTADFDDIGLGIPGFSFADLHRPDRLRDLYERFSEQVAAADPVFWAEWDALRAAPDAPPSPVAVSRLLVTMSRRVSAFLTRLFRLEEPVEAAARRTHEQDDLFRFKVEFVRRRVVPMVKAGDVHPTADDQAIVEQLVDATGVEDVELAVARAGCALLDQEAQAGTPGGVAPTPAREVAAGSDADREAPNVSRAIEALKRWCAARLHDARYRGWVTFRFPETLDYHHLVPLEHPQRDLPEAATGPDSRLRRRDGFTLTDPRMNGREVLERDPLLRALPRARQGLVLEGLCATRTATPQRTRSASRSRAARSTRRSPRCTCCASDGDAIGALALVDGRQPDVRRAPATASATTA